MTKGLASLCHALGRVEAANSASIQKPELPRIRVLIPLRPRSRPHLIDFSAEKKSVQTEFSFDTSQLQLFEGVR
jgi:hypothetical protein